MKISKFKVSDIKKVESYLVLTFAPGTIEVVNNYDIEFVNSDEFKIECLADNNTIQIFSNDLSIWLLPKRIQRTNHINGNSLLQSEVFKLLIHYEVSEFFELQERNNQQINHLLLEIEEMNRLHAIDLALEKRDYETCRKLYKSNIEMGLFK